MKMHFLNDSPSQNPKFADALDGIDGFNGRNWRCLESIPDYRSHSFAALQKINCILSR